MTTIPIRTKKEESWAFIYSAYASLLALVPLILHFINIGWAYKIALFYLAFLGISYGTLLSNRGHQFLVHFQRKFSNN